MPPSSVLDFPQALEETVDPSVQNVMDTNLHRKRNPIAIPATLAELNDWVMTMEILMWEQDRWNSVRVWPCTYKVSMWSKRQTAWVQILAHPLAMRPRVSF